MNSTHDSTPASHQTTDPEKQKAEANRTELTERITRALPEDGRMEPMDGLFLNRSSTTNEPLHAVVAQPCFCVIAQGEKEIHLGEHRYQYDPYKYLLVTAELPLTGQVLDASEEAPYLSLRLDLDPSLVSSVMVEAGHTAPPDGSDVRALDVNPLSDSLLDAAVRLVRLLEEPEDAPVLKPMITREIIYRLLQGEQGERLRHIAVLNGQEHRIAEAVRRLRQDFDQSIQVEDLAAEFGMSQSSFYQHFKDFTGMSPLQFQKQIRLQEARRLMLGEDLNASTAGYRVGYDNPSHFSREYKREFGRPPMQEVERIKETKTVPIE
ncbi:AraC family transcriptional regulator [Salinibacter sp. 10B]|uniref:AraC family transcriptional regulator n=1 Tax=Salinibacter sp. 10B TaxID=1923971 RepID=UPI000CF47990|nr:AraC family transcriptional regulator [Salinibacter sp. 10B]PQJ35352.1 AraC family transcriptional regulator [Salinibacter sp. 10B]